MGKPDKKTTETTVEPRITTEAELNSYGDYATKTFTPEYTGAYGDTQRRFTDLAAREGQTQGFRDTINRQLDPTNGANIYADLRRNAFDGAGRAHAERFGGTGSAGSSLSQIDLARETSSALVNADYGAFVDRENRALNAAGLDQDAYEREKQMQAQYANQLYANARDYQGIYQGNQQFAHNAALAGAGKKTIEISQPGDLTIASGVIGAFGTGVKGAAGLGFGRK